MNNNFNFSGNDNPNSFKINTGSSSGGFVVNNENSNSLESTINVTANPLPQVSNPSGAGAANPTPDVKPAEPPKPVDPLLEGCEEIALPKLCDVSFPECMEAEAGAVEIKDGVLVSLTTAYDCVELPRGIKKMCDYGKNETVRALVLPMGLVEIGEYAFWKYPKLEQIYIPSTVRTIGKQAFSRLRNLHTVIIAPGVQKICDGAFQDCLNLRYLELPNTVEEIGYGAFSGTAITSVVLPSSLRKTDFKSFGNCKKLTHVFLQKDAHDLVMHTSTFFESRVTLCVPKTPEGEALKGKYTSYNGISKAQFAYAKREKGESLFEQFSELFKEKENVRRYVDDKIAVAEERIRKEEEDKRKRDEARRIEDEKQRREADEKKIEETVARKVKEEQELRAKRRAEYDKLIADLAEQQKIAEENKGGIPGIGKKYKLRIEALDMIEKIELKLLDYPEFNNQNQNGAPDSKPGTEIKPEIKPDQTPGTTSGS